MPVLTQPSYAAQILTVAARILDMHPAEPVNRAVANAAVNIAVTAITATLPEAVRDAAITRAANVRPVADSGTCAHYADTLRACATHIDTKAHA